MMLSMFKLFHLICGVSFFGIMLAAFFYIARSIKKCDRSLIDYSIRASYFGDLVVLLCIIILLASSTPLISVGHFTRSVPWIFVAYHAFSCLVVLWLLNVVIKFFFLSKPIIASSAVKTFYFLNMAMILIFIVIIHDAVMRSTWLEFLFRK